MEAPKVTVAPEGVRPWLADAVQAGGGTLVPPEQADAVVWAEPARAEELRALLEGPAAAARWVQLPWAGIEPYVGVVADHAERIWTCGKGVYANPVAEHALALLLGGLRGIGRYARRQSWSEPYGTNLVGAKVAVLGGGGITEELLAMLVPFGCDVTVLRRNPDGGALPGNPRVVGPEGLHSALDGAVGVVLALALTPATAKIIGAAELALLHPRGWLVNVARGGHVDTDALVAALRAGAIGGAALDVTDPEPPPPEHPLWGFDNVIITPHVANTPEMALPLLAARITDNVRRWAHGDELVGLVDPAAGY